MLNKNEYIKWFNGVVKRDYTIKHWEDDRKSIVYHDYKSDMEEDGIHELSSRLTKSGNPEVLFKE